MHYSILFTIHVLSSKTVQSHMYLPELSTPGITIIYYKSSEYRIAGFLHRVLIFAFFTMQNDLVKINSH